jgi:hypothetical protein
MLYDRGGAMKGKDLASYLADKICNGGDYGKQAAFVLLRQADEIEALRLALNRIVSYYDLAKNGSSLPSMTVQARAEHENTMFGQARAALTYNAELKGGA